MASSARLPEIAHRIPCVANVSFLFPRLNLLESLEAAAAHGFHRVELLDPFALAAPELERNLDRLGLRVELMNLPFGDFATGERGIAGNPNRQAEFLDGLAATAELAERIRPTKVNVLAGVALEGTSRIRQMDVLRANLGRTVDRLEPLGVMVVTELLNERDTPGFLLGDLERIREILDRLEGRVRFQLDVYHLDRAGEAVISSIQVMARAIGHVQIADSPGRTEPGSGKLDMPKILDAISVAEYPGPIGLEYGPSRPDADLFGWMAEMGCVCA
jgi:hydroxypyruvate isomerase